MFFVISMFYMHFLFVCKALTCFIDVPFLLMCYSCTFYNFIATQWQWLCKVYVHISETQQNTSNHEEVRGLYRGEERKHDRQGPLPAMFNFNIYYTTNRSFFFCFCSQKRSLSIAKDEHFFVELWITLTCETLQLLVPLVCELSFFIRQWPFDLTQDLQHLLSWFTIIYIFHSAR